MTDAIGRRARWTAALVVAPSAAALFGVSVSWADHARPTTAPAPKPRVVPGAATTATAAASAQRGSAALAQRQREAAALTKQLATLRQQLAVEAAAVAASRNFAATNPGAAPNSPTGPGAYVAPAPAPAAAAQPAPAPVAAAPAPPAVQVTTGASGAPP